MKILSNINRARLPMLAAVLLVAGALFASCGGGYGGGSYGSTGMITAPGGFTLVSPSPASGTTMGGPTPTFAWSSAVNAADYRVEVDTTGMFTGPFTINTAVAATTYSFTVPGGALTTGTMYHWRILAENIYGQTVAGPRTYTP